MKKITFLVVALCATLFASAASYTFTASNYAPYTVGDIKFTSAEGFVITTDKTTAGATTPAYNAAGDIRVYANGTITITSPTDPMTSISFLISEQGKKRMTTLTASTGTVQTTGSPDYKAIWSGNSKTVTITVGEKATLGTEGATKAGQLAFTAMTVVTNGEGGGDPVDPDPVGEYPIVEGQATYLGTDYTTNQLFVVDLFSDLQFDELGAPTADGVWMSLELFTATANAFTGTYTVGTDDVVGHIGTEYSVVITMVGETESELALASGSVTIEWVSADLYNVTYDITAENSVKYTGTVSNIEIIAYTEDGDEYVVNNEGGDPVDPDPVGEYPMVEAEVTYSVEYSSPAGQNFYMGIYSDMVWADGGMGYLVPTTEGNYVVLDLYAPTATSFVGTYSFDDTGSFAAGTFSADYSYWSNVSATGVETELGLTAGTVTITANGAGSYTIVYNVTDETNTVHTGSLTYNVDIYDDNGEDYSGSINDDGTAVSHVEASLEVYTRNGNIVVPAAAGERITVYNMMGQTLYTGVAQSGETTVAGLSANQVLVVRAGNKTAKVVL